MGLYQTSAPLMTPTRFELQHQRKKKLAYYENQRENITVILEERLQGL